MGLKIGIKYVLQQKVKYEDTAAKYGSGLVKVFATPAMIALMENTCLKSVQNYLPEGHTTVGTNVNINHIKATPIEMQVECESELINIEGKKLVFSITAKDEEGVIGNGTHTRYIIDSEKFMSKFDK